MQQTNDKLNGTSHAIFKITRPTTGVYAALHQAGQPQTETLSVTVYVRLKDVTEQAAIAVLKQRIDEDYRPQSIDFMFWADSCSSGGGSALVIIGNAPESDSREVAPGMVVLYGRRPCQVISVRGDDVVLDAGEGYRVTVKVSALQPYRDAATSFWGCSTCSHAKADHQNGSGPCFRCEQEKAVNPCKQFVSTTRRDVAYRERESQNSQHCDAGWMNDVRFGTGGDE